LSADLLERLKSSDITTITQNSKLLSKAMFAQMNPKQITQIQNGIQKGIDAIQTALDRIDKNIQAVSHANAPGSQAALAGMQKAQMQLSDTKQKMTTLKDAVPSAFTTAENNYIKEIDSRKETIEKEYQKTLNVGFKQLYMTVTISAVLALLVLLFYRKPKSEID
jgi:uncharacterized protein YdcH (DUF465 family)